MAYKRTMKRPMQRRTPLMFGGPTPVNMAPAMAGCCGTGEYIAVGDDEIEMPAEFVGKGADPNTIMGKPVVGAGFLSSIPTVVKLAALGGLAYYFLKKKR